MADNVAPISSKNIRPVEPSLKPQQLPDKASKVGGFQDILKSKLNSEIKFSGHALERLVKRNIILTSQDLEKLKIAVQKAEEKGSRESLVLMDNLALIVSIKNRTVITTIDGAHLKENVFTNIDSAVII